MWKNLIPWKNPWKKLAVRPAESNRRDEGGALSTDVFEREFSRLRRDFERLMERMWSGLPALDDDFFGGPWGTDYEETDTHYVARVAAPGFEPDEFDVQIRGDSLIIRAEHKESQKGEDGSSFRYGRLERVIPLPEPIEPEKIDARYHNGVLELRLPKSQPSQAQRITVKAG
jgi:HSP20 family protein